MNAVERVMMMQSCIASNGFMFGQGRLPFRPSWDVLKARLRREGLAPGARMVHGQAELIGVAIACPRWGSIPVASATWRAKVDTCPKSLEESRNFRHDPDNSPVRPFWDLA
jgi:hypothetical protein